MISFSSGRNALQFQDKSSSESILLVSGWGSIVTFALLLVLGLLLLLFASGEIIVFCEEFKGSLFRTPRLLFVFRSFFSLRLCGELNIGFSFESFVLISAKTN
jgi:hypothetical protein